MDDLIIRLGMHVALYFQWYQTRPQRDPTSHSIRGEASLAGKGHWYVTSRMDEWVGVRG